MKTVEIILSSLVGLGLIFWLLVWPGASIMLVIGLSLLSILYFWLSFALLNGIRFRNAFKRESYREINSRRILGAVGAGIALSMVTIGALFRLMFWPGNDIMLLEGLICLAVVSAIALSRYKKELPDFYRKVYLRFGVFGLLALALFLAPVESLVNFKYRSNPEYAKALNNTIAEPENVQYREELQRQKDSMNGYIQESRR